MGEVLVTLCLLYVVLQQRVHLEAPPPLLLVFLDNH